MVGGAVVVNLRKMVTADPLLPTMGALPSGARNDRLVRRLMAGRETPLLRQGASRLVFVRMRRLRSNLPAMFLVRCLLWWSLVLLL